MRKRSTARRLLAARRMAAASLVVLLVAVVSACGSSATAKAPVRVAYAGALVGLMEHTIAPAFTHATGYSVQGQPGGSIALASQIAGHLLSPDVFISVSDPADQALEGTAHGNVVRWYVHFGTTAMVIGYSRKSRFASAFAAAAAGKVPWYTVLEQPGLRLGRTDPLLDPKGINTLLTMQLAARFYQQPGMGQAILGSAENTQQIFPEEDLVARLGVGQLDAGFFYLNEVKDAGLPYITLPPQINLGDPAQAAYYAHASYTNAQGHTTTGAPILYSLTIPSTVHNEVGAEAFVRFLLSGTGRTALTNAGILAVPLTLVGDAAAVPSGLRSLVGA